MHDTVVSITAAGGVTLFGIATGLQPELLVAGAAGGWWAMSYQPPIKPFTRANRIVLSSLIAAWLTPLTLHLIGRYVEEIPTAAALPVALCVGLISIDVLGSGFTRIAKKLLARVAKTQQEET
jgi:hypothetical protein